jgi:hypothetical protein
MAVQYQPPGVPETAPSMAIFIWHRQRSKAVKMDPTQKTVPICIFDHVLPTSINLTRVALEAQ